MSKEITEDWLYVFESDVKRGRVLADSVYWRLALFSLPEGVDESDERVKAALIKIEESVKLKEAKR